MRSRSLALCALLAFACLAQPRPAFPQESSPETAVVGRPAPEIRVTDWIDGDGRSALADFRGEVVLLDFWATSCPVSRSQVAHLNRLQQEYGRKGLVVLGVTSEDRRTVQRYMAHEDAAFGFAVGLGGAPGYATPTIPHAALVAADGTVAFLGNPAGLSTRDIEAVLRRAPKPTAAEQEARAARRLAGAEALLAARDVLRAESVLQRLVASHPATPSGRAAAARLKDLATGELAAEHAAQRELAKLVGGTVERPAEADSKRLQKLAKAFEKRAAEWRESAPRAAALAAEWREIAATTWADVQRAQK